MGSMARIDRLHHGDFDRQNSWMLGSSGRQEIQFIRDWLHNLMHDRGLEAI
jgi:hypothetical protein